MNKKFLSAILFGALMVTSTGTFVSCKDYDDDIDRLDQEISNVKDAIKALEDKVGSGKYVESCTPFTDGNGGYEIKFSDGETIKLYNGAKGEQGEPGKPGTPGTPGTSADDYVVSVEEGESAYELVITYADGTKKTISMPKATSVVSGVKFIPTFLSEGEAARIHFPTIVTDSVAGKTEITGADWSTNNFSTFKIVYSGKADVKYQVNPNSVSFKDMEVVGFVRDTAEIWNYNTNNRNWELFNAGQKLYTDGKITVESYKEGHGMLNFRVKDWAFAEQSNLDERTVYSLRIKNNDQIVHSDFVPAKHEVILQKNVHLVKVADAFDQTNAPAQIKNAIAPNKVNYREFIKDEYYLNTLNPTGTEEAKLKAYQADKAKFEANAENQLYKGDAESKDDAERIVVELNYTGDGHSKNLKDIVTSFFDKRMGRAQDAQYPLMENGFDDYSLVFEPVDFYYDGVNQTKRYLDVTKFEANAENQLYKGDAESKDDAERIVVELNYTGDGHSKNLKDIVTSFFDKRMGRAQDAQYPLMENGFDDYSLVFEPVDFYYDGVNQTKRYLDVTKDGVATVKQTPDPIWGAETDASHTAAIDRTPIVRVKLVAPGEDNGNVVKTAIIKIHIVRKTVVPEINITETKDVTLKHINQVLDMDMDKIFNHKDVQLSKDEFRKTYDFVPEFATADEAKQHAVYAWDGKDNADYSLDPNFKPEEYNQLFVTVKNTAFSRHDDHDVYTVKGTYKPNADHKGLSDIHVTYTINVKYPDVVAPEKTKLNWVDDSYFIAHGRYDNFDTPTTYEMVAVLNDEFDLINYNPYKGQTHDKDWARATLSFELVDQHNNASKIGDGHNSGIRLYQGKDNKWYIALEATDEGRTWINAADAKDLKKIKMRAVVSFNEDVDGLYGTCNKEANAHNKYAKEDYNNFSCDTINMVNNTPWAKDHTTTYTGAPAPENGRSTVVIDEFEVAFVTPMVFHAYEAGPLYDKYQEAENTVSLKDAFFLSDYLWSEGAQAQFNNNHVIYDHKDMAKNNTLVQTGDQAGWSKKLVVDHNVFDVNTTVNFKVSKAYFADGSELDAENMKKIKLDNANQTITWINNGEDIAQPFTIDVEVCVNHKWGGICDHTWKNDRGHSVGTIQIQVKKHNDK